MDKEEFMREWSSVDGEEGKDYFHMVKLDDDVVLTNHFEIFQEGVVFYLQGNGMSKEVKRCKYEDILEVI